MNELTTPMHFLLTDGQRRLLGLNECHFLCIFTCSFLDMYRVRILMVKAFFSDVAENELVIK